jgi:hypothetical protein
MADSEGVSCLECREPLRAGAGKCVRCNAYQDWRRYFAFSTTVLSLLIALLSVATVCIPVLIDALRPADAVIRLSIGDISTPSLAWSYYRQRAGWGDLPPHVADRFEISLVVRLVATNSGTRPGVIEAVDVRGIYLDDPSKVFAATLIAGNLSGPIPVNPGQTVLFEAHCPGVPGGTYNRAFQITASVVLFSGTKKTETFTKRLPKA